VSAPPSLPVVVVGAGAAGLMAAIFAARARPPGGVVLLERTRDGGRKILVSGGGRCNVLPQALAPERFVTDSSLNTLRKMLLSWPLGEQLAFFTREAGVPLTLESASAKYFPVSNRARDVRDALLALAAAAGVQTRFGVRLEGLAPEGTGTERSWRLDLDGGSALSATAVILATGGLSLPGTGSDGHGLELLRALGHTVHPTYPALTPLLGSSPAHAALAGLSRTVTLRAPGRGPGGRALASTGGFLFTHRGYSGPVVSTSRTSRCARAAAPLLKGSRRSGRSSTRRRGTRPCDSARERSAACSAGTCRSASPARCLPRPASPPSRRSRGSPAPIGAAWSSC
jgi:predicted Rossmann fold flavoprotein